MQQKSLTQIDYTNFTEQQHKSQDIVQQDLLITGLKDMKSFLLNKFNKENDNNNKQESKSNNNKRKVSK